MCCDCLVCGENEMKRDVYSQFYNFTVDINIKWFKVPLFAYSTFACLSHVHIVFII